MWNFSKLNSIKLFILFILFVFVSLAFLHKANNALPFFYKDYHTYKINGKENFDEVSESLVLNRLDFHTLSMEYEYSFSLWFKN